MTTMTLMYLGPEGTFTHQAALNAAEQLRGVGDVSEFTLKAMSDIPSLLQAVEAGEGWGVVAWENNVEGYVVPNLDALIDSADLAGFAHVGVDVSFDAFVRGDDAPATIDGAEVFAHSHGLAQCKKFIDAHHLQPVPSTSNAAACRDLQAGQVALGPSICGKLYGLNTVNEGVQDFDDAHTEFLVIAPRATVQELHAGHNNESGEYETIVTFIPLVTGSGVLANLLDVIRDAGLNMTSFISRPIKGRDGTYSFIATLDAAPWESKFKAVIKEIVEHGDWVKTLAIYPRRERPNPPVDAWMLPQGGVHGTLSDDDAARRELLW